MDDISYVKHLTDKQQQWIQDSTGVPERWMREILKTRWYESDKHYDFVGKLCRDHEKETVRDFANAVMNLEDSTFIFYKEEYEKLKPFFKIALDKEYEKYKKRPKFETR